MKGDDKKQSAPFSLSTATASSSFSSKSNDIFASLDALESKHNAHNKVQPSDRSFQREGVIKDDPLEEDQERFHKQNQHKTTNTSYSHHRQRDRDYKHDGRNKSWGSSSSRGKRDYYSKDWDGFQRPRPPKSRATPDYKMHPEKWTCYSLDDVSDDDLSDKANKRAAFDFLAQRKEAREREERLAAGLPEFEEKFESETAACSKGVISFTRKKSHKVQKSETERSSHASDSDKNCGSKSKSDVSKFDRDEECSESDFLNVKIVPISSVTSTDEVSSTNNEDSSPSQDAVLDGTDTDKTVQFKSRKNVKKHIRRKIQDDDTENDL